MYNEDYAKVKEVFQDEEFVKKLSEQTEPEDAQAVFAEKGIELTIEDIMEIHDKVVRYHEGKLTEEEQKLLSAAQKDYSGEELTDEELELVSGGMSEATAKAIVGWVWTGICVAAVVACFVGLLW